MRGVAELAGKPAIVVAGAEPRVSAVDRLMERASVALAEMRYFEAERLCVRALGKAYAAFDYGCMARVLLPLQECRRQKRQLAIGAGAVVLVGDAALAGGAPMAGCYLFRPPLIGADAREFRERADSAGSAVLALTREPMSLDGKWPIVSVGSSRSVRTKVDPPWAVVRVEGAPTRDDSLEREVPLAWFEAAAEALGDAAIARIDARDHPVWRVDDLMEALDAFPAHEKLHQALAGACREAAVAPAPELRRKSVWTDDPYAF